MSAPKKGKVAVDMLETLLERPDAPSVIVMLTALVFVMTVYWIARSNAKNDDNMQAALKVLSDIHLSNNTLHEATIKQRQADGERAEKTYAALTEAVSKITATLGTIENNLRLQHQRIETIEHRSIEAADTITTHLVKHNALAAQRHEATQDQLKELAEVLGLVTTSLQQISTGVATVKTKQDQATLEAQGVKREIMQKLDAQNGLELLQSIKATLDQFIASLEKPAVPSGDNGNEPQPAEGPQVIQGE